MITLRELARAFRHYIALALVLPALVNAAPLQDPLPELRELGTRVRSGEVAAALAALEGARDLPEPVRPCLVALRASLLVKANRRADAVSLLESATAGRETTEPGQLGALVLLANLHAEGGAHAKVVPLTQRLLQAFPAQRRRYDLKLLLAQALAKTGGGPEAVEAALSLSESKLQNLPSRLAFSSLYRQFVAKTFPKDLPADAWLRFGRVLLKRGNFGDAGEVAQRVLGRPAGAAASARSTLPPDVEARALLLAGEAELRRRRGDAAWAHRLLERALALPAPPSIRAHACYLAGDSASCQGEFGHAATHYQRILDDFGDTDWCAASLHQLVNLARKTGDPKQALACAADLVRRYPRSWYASALSWSLAWDRYARGSWREAAEAFGDYALVAPRDRLAPTALYWRAKALRQLGDGAAVEATLQSLLALPVPGLYHLAAARLLEEHPDRKFPAGLPMPRFYGYQAKLPLLHGLLPPRPADGWVDPGELVDPETAERLNLLKEYDLVDPLADELERLVGLSPQSNVLRNDLSWALERVGAVSQAIEQAELALERPDPYRDIDRAQLLSKAYPRPMRPFFEDACKAQGVPLTFAYAIAREESRFNPELESWAGAKGVMQIMNATGRWLAGLMGVRRFSPAQLHGPRLNVQMGVWYLGWLHDRFSALQDTDLLVMGAYNGGPGHVPGWLRLRGSRGVEELIEGIRAEETRIYVKKVSTALLCYELLDRGEQPLVAAWRHPREGTPLTMAAVLAAPAASSGKGRTKVKTKTKMKTKTKAKTKVAVKAKPQGKVPAPAKVPAKPVGASAPAAARSTAPATTE